MRDGRSYGMIMSAGLAGKKLKTLREKTGLTIQEVANAVGMPLSTYASYEDKYKQDYLPQKLLKKILPLFTSHGIDWNEILTLFGLDFVTEGITMLSRGGEGRHSRAKRGANGKTRSMAEIVELDIRVSAGGGAMNEDGKPIGTWMIPAAVLEGQTTAPFTKLRIITVISDSMEPDLPAGTRVMVDTEDRRPTPPGVFVLWDGLGLVVKRIEHIPKSDPPRLKIKSDNPRYDAYELTADEAEIQGRVIGRWHRM